MKPYISKEVENCLLPEDIARAVVLLNRVANTIEERNISYDVVDSRISGRVIGMCGRSINIEVSLTVSGTHVNAYGERFSCREWQDFSSIPLPQTLDELAARIPSWISQIGAATDPLVIQHQKALEKQAMDALQAAATARDPDWYHLTLTRYSSSIVHAVVHGSKDTLNYATASICPSENALPLSKALSHQLDGFAGNRYITGNCRRRDDALDIAMSPPGFYIIENTLSPIGKLRAIALAAEKDYRLLD